MNQSVSKGEKYKYIFSLGYRCSSASILKRLGYKNESYPFDWLVSRLRVIEDCCVNRFAKYLDRKMYQRLWSATYNYDTATSEPQWVCQESCFFHKGYLREFLGLTDSPPGGEQDNSDKIYEINVPRPLEVPRDAYAFPLLINHRNIMRTEDYTYYERCVARWWYMMSDKSAAKLSLYIHPMFHESEFLAKRDSIVDEITRFHWRFQQVSGIRNHDGIYIIPVKTQFAYPIHTHIGKCPRDAIEEIKYERMGDLANTTSLRILLLWCNKDIMDAGEIFMGNMWIETDTLCDVVREYIHGGHILQI